MRVGPILQVRTETKTDNSVILFWVGPYRMGIRAAALKEIRSVRRLSSKGDLSHQEEAPGCDVILSAGELFGVQTGPGGRLLVLRMKNIGVRVDQVERMVEIGKLYPLPKAFQGAERSWYSGITLAGDLIVPMLSPETLAGEALSKKAQHRRIEGEGVK